MTISPTAPLRSATYVGNGVTTTFAFPFFVLTPEEVSVYLDNVLLDTGFGVSPIPSGGLYGGTVSFTTAPATGVKIDIVDRPMISQERDYTNQAGVYPDDVERALDKLTRIVRRLSYDLVRAVKAPVGAAQERSVTPGAPGTTPVWDVAGNLVPGTTGPVVIAHEAALKNLPELLASTRTYSAGTVITTRAEGFAYEVVASGGDLTTASGVRLKSLGDVAVPDAFRLAGDPDDTQALGRAIATGKAIRLLGRDYIINNTSPLQLQSGQVIIGSGGVAAYSGGYTGSATRLICTGSGPAVFGGPAILNHIRISGLTIYVTGAYDWVFSFRRMSGFDLADMRIEVANNVTGAIKTQKAAITDSSWVLNWSNVRVRLPDASTARPVDIDMGDGQWIGCDFTGGIGSRIAGTGGLKIIVCRMDRSSTYGLTIAVLSDARVQHTIIGCQIEENDVGGILINADANDARAEPWVMPTIVGNMFRNRQTAVADIDLRNETGGVIRGGNIVGNTHSTTVLPFRKSANWLDVHVAGGQHNGPRAVVGYLGDAYRQPPLLLAQGRGNETPSGTSETTVLTVPIPANSIGDNGALRVRVKFTHANTANVKTIRVKLGTLTVATLDAASSNTSALDVDIQNNGTGAQIVHPAGLVHGTSTTNAIIGAIDTTQDQDLIVTIQRADGSEAIGLRTWNVTLYPAY